MSFASVPDLIRSVRDGRPVVLIDDHDRENEGDLVLAAGRIDADAIRFLVNHGRGLICAPVAPEIADELRLPVLENDAGLDVPGDPHPLGCAFTIPVDARDGITTGISARDRCRTLQLLADPQTRAEDLRRPGHIFPLRAHEQGVLGRRGHTEAAVELARLAGLPPVGVICEILKDDGTMARLPDLEEFVRTHDLLLGNIADIVAYCREHHVDAMVAEPQVSSPVDLRELSSARLPTPLGTFDMHVFRNDRARHPDDIVVLSMGKLDGVSGKGAGETPEGPPGVLTRVHSACFTGDVLGSLRCDCGGQLEMAIGAIGKAEHGLLIYLPQEGRGIGLASKLEAYRLQEGGLDTVEANHALGFPADLRLYDEAVAILRHFGVDRVRLMTNNPAKIDGLAAGGIEVTERIPIEPGPGEVNRRYLRVKKGKMGHFFEAV